MNATCAHCNQPLTQPTGRGRRKTYCGQRCRKAANRNHHTNPIPHTMRTATRWTRADGKRPITTTGHPASSTKPHTWDTYTNTTTGPGTGQGFMLGNGYACIDLDHCINPDGTLTPTAQGVVQNHPHNYIEISQSGTGLHIFGTHPECKGTKRPGVEFYTTGRFILTTGRVYQHGELTPLHQP